MSEIKQHYLLEKYFVDNDYYVIVSEKCQKKKSSLSKTGILGKSRSVMKPTVFENETSEGRTIILFCLSTWTL